MRRLANLIFKYYRVILLSSIIVLCLSIYALTKLQISSKMDDMLPNNSPALKASHEFEQFFSSEDNAIIVVKGKSEDCINFLEELELLITKEKITNNIIYKTDISVLNQNQILYLDKDFFLSIDNAISSDQINTIQDLLSELENSETNSIEYLTNDKENVFMMVLKPKIDKINYVESRQHFYDTTVNILNKTLEKDAYSRLDAGLTGGAFIQDIEADMVAFNGFGSTFIITLLLIIIIVVFFLKRFFLSLVMVYPLLLGATCAGAIAYLIYGSLNIFSISFALLLIGLGIDFAIHLLNRYNEERGKNNDLINSMETSIKATGISIIFGTITTAAAFFAFIFADFKAFTQMGSISAIGIIILSFIMLLLVPSFILLLDSKKEVKYSIRSERKTLKKTGDFIEKHPLIPLVIILLLIPLLFNHVINMRIIGNMEKIYPHNMESKKWEKVVKEEFSYNPNVLTFIVDDELELVEVITDLSNRQDVKYIDSAYSYLPQDQEYKIAVVKKLTAYLESYGINNPKLQSVEKLTVFDLPEEIKANYIGKDNKLLVELVPNVNIYDIDSYDKLSTAIEDLTGNIPVGMPTIMNEVIKTVEADILRVALISLAIVTVFIAVLFKSIKTTIITIIPVIVTLYLTIGILPLLKLNINIFSVAAFPLIIGIGIDSSIHLMHRLKSDYELGFGYIYMTTGKAIILTSFTTLIGFGSLTFINHPGMSNLGATVAVGIFICIIVTLTLLPVLCKLFVNKLK